MALESDRVRRHTSAEVLRRIDGVTEESLTQNSASPGAIKTRLAQLDREWDTDRTIETEAALMALTGLALGTLVRPALLAVPAAVAGALFLHAVAGWYPLLPIFRRAGIRSAREIARERYALKAMRGDFAGLGGGAPS